MKKIILLLSIALLFACNPCKKLTEPIADTVKSEIIMIQKDTIIKMAPDSISFYMFLECDSNNNVLIKEIESRETTGLKLEYLLKNNRLNLSVVTDSIEVLNRLLNEKKINVVHVENPTNVKLQDENEKLLKKINRRQWLIWYFIGSLSALILYLIFKLKLLKLI